MTSGQGKPKGASDAGTRSGDALHSNPDIWAPRLARVLDQQRAIYERLELLSARQSLLIMGDQTDELLGVLGERQTLIDQLTDLNEQMTPFTERWGELSARLSDRQREELRERFEDVSRLVESIARRDESDRAALEARRGDVGRELESLSRGRGAVAAYGRAQVSGYGGEARFQDRRG